MLGPSGPCRKDAVASASIILIPDGSKCDADDSGAPPTKDGEMAAKTPAARPLVAGAVVVAADGTGGHIHVSSSTMRISIDDAVAHAKALDYSGDVEGATAEYLGVLEQIKALFRKQKHSPEVDDRLIPTIDRPALLAIKEECSKRIVVLLEEMKATAAGTACVELGLITTQPSRTDSHRKSVRKSLVQITQMDLTDLTKEQQHRSWWIVLGVSIFLATLGFIFMIMSFSCASHYLTGLQAKYMLKVDDRDDNIDDGDNNGNGPGGDYDLYIGTCLGTPNNRLVLSQMLYMVWPALYMMLTLSLFRYFFLRAFGAVRGKWRIDRLHEKRARMASQVTGLQPDPFKDTPSLTKYFTDTLDMVRQVSNNPVPLTIEFEALTCHVPDGSSGKKLILRNATGALPAKQLTAIMGASGCGKSTLCACLLGDLQTTSGSIRINGKPAPNALLPHHKIVGVVTQGDIMLPEMTVTEVLTLSARMRLPSKVSSDLMVQYVTSVIDVLKLTEVKHSRIGDERQRGLSGGQKKRVNIGMEMVASPVCILLDEPTSGLDASCAYDVMSALSNAAKKGWTVGAVIHQPRASVFLLMDNVVVLDSKGRTAYFGKTSKAANYFTGLGYKFPIGENPADILIDITTGSQMAAGGLNTSELALKWRMANKNTNMKSAARTHPAASGWDRRARGPCGQLWLMYKRSSIQYARNWGMIFKCAVLLLVLGFMIGQMFYNANPKSCKKQKWSNPEKCYKNAYGTWMGQLQQAFILLVLVITLISCQAALDMMGTERLVFAREARAGYWSLPYILGKNLARIPINILFPVIFMTACFPSLRIRSVQSYSQMACIIIFTCWTAEGWGQFVSIVANKNRSVVGGVVSLLFIATTGSFPILKSPVAKAMSYFSMCRWTVELLLINVHKVYYFADGDTDVFGSKATIQKRIDEVFDKFGYSMNNESLAFSMLILNGILIRFATFLALRQSTQRKRGSGISATVWSCIKCLSCSCLCSDS